MSNENCKLFSWMTATQHNIESFVNKSSINGKYFARQKLFIYCLDFMMMLWMTRCDAKSISGSNMRRDSNFLIFILLAFHFVRALKIKWNRSCFRNSIIKWKECLNLKLRNVSLKDWINERKKDLCYGIIIGFLLRSIVINFPFYPMKLPSIIVWEFHWRTIWKVFH